MTTLAYRPILTTAHLSHTNASTQNIHHSLKAAEDIVLKFHRTLRRRAPVLQARSSFNPAIAYTRQYSGLRRQQAEGHMSIASNPTFAELHCNSAWTPRLCIGIASGIHDPAGNIDFAIGSLLDGLTKYGRDRRHLVALFDGDDSNQSLELSEPWLRNPVDEALVANITDRRHIPNEQLPQFYYLLDTCQKLKAPYTAVLEHSIIAMDGRLHRTLAALDDLEEKTTKDERTPEDFLYLSLFHSKRSLGWKREDFPVYVTAVVSFFAAVAIDIITVRKCIPARQTSFHGKSHPNHSSICTPSIIALYLAAGKVRMLHRAPSLSEARYTG